MHPQFRLLLAGNGVAHWPILLRRSRGASARSSSSNSASTSGRGSYFERVKGWQGPWKAALTSGTLSAAGDLLAQFVQMQIAQREGKPSPAYEYQRTLRMFGFGLFLYGPYQYYWYNLLDWLMPIKTTGTFLTKVAANQLLLAPVTLTTVFAWNLYWLGKGSEIPTKISNDLLPTMKNGWKFWIPAASINFYAIPLEYQVLYMSACGVLWTAYLSYASTNNISNTGSQAGGQIAPPGKQARRAAV